jgi:3-methyladenine DNA glycosylase/8-oxoguanine DNA glycosylase
LAGAWDGFEYAVRAVLGQQVSVSAASKLVARVVERAGARLTTEHPALTHAFPDPTAVLNTNWEDLGVPRARSNALLAVSRAAIEQPDLFVPGATLEQDVERLMQIAGVGPWTAQTIALRALLDAATALGIVGASALEKHAARWQPFRGYAAAHLWAVKSDGASTLRSVHSHESNPVHLEACALPRSNRDSGGNAGALVRRGGRATRSGVRQRPRAHAE